MLTKIRTFLRHSENVKYDLHQHLMTQHMQKVNKLHEWKGIECFHAFQWMELETSKVPNLTLYGCVPSE